MEGLSGLCKLGLTAFHYLMVGVLWFLTVIFGFGLTLGASTTAAYVMVTKLRTHEEDKVLKPFITAFINNFIPATCMWVVILIIQRFLVFFMFNTHLYGPLETFFGYVYLFLIIELFLLGLYVFPLIAKYKNTFYGYIKSGITILHAHLFRTISILIMLVIVLFFIFKVEPTFVFIMVPVYFVASERLFADTFKLYES